MSRIILVTGATGKQGGAVINALHKSKGNWRIRALTRNPSAANSKALARQGVEVVFGNWDDSDSLRTALQGVYGVFSVTTNLTKGGAETEIRQGKNLAEAAAAANIQHYIYSSVGGADRSSGVPHFDSKWEVEEHIRAVGLPYTILRPVMFMDNFLGFFPRMMLLSLLKSLVAHDKTVQMIATRDIGAFAALAFDDRDRFMDTALQLAGDELNRANMISTLKQQKVQPNIALTLPNFMVRNMPDDVIRMFRWFNDVGYDADISKIRALRPEILDLAKWAGKLKK